MSKVELMFIQHAYILSILKELKMDDANLSLVPLLEGLKLGHELDVELFNVFIYYRLVGKCIYLLNSKKDLLFLVGVLNMYMHDPREPHWQAIKHVL
jgi:hypothetical protein